MTLVFDSYTFFLIFLTLYLIVHYSLLLLNLKALAYFSTIAFSAVFIYLASLGTLAFTAVSACLVIIYFKVGQRRLLWLAAISITGLFIATRIYDAGEDFATYFSAFVFIRSLGTLLFARRFPKSQGSIQDILLALVFFPLFSVGPINFYDTVNKQALTRLPTFEDMGVGLRRILWGTAKIGWLGPEVTSQLSDLFLKFNHGGLTTAYIIPAAFGFLLHIYVMFSGYTDIAVGVSRLVAIRSRENFNRPWAARSLQEFWQRWHMSLVWTTNNLGYQPFVRRTGARYLGIVLAFTFIGLWHAFTWQYLTWGLLHGCGLALQARLARHPKFRAWWEATCEMPACRFLVLALGWLLTLTYVSALSFLAAGDFG